MSSDKTYTSVGAAIAFVLVLLSIVFAGRQFFAGKKPSSTIEMAFVFIITLFLGYIVLEIV